MPRNRHIVNNIKIDQEKKMLTFVSLVFILLASLESTIDATSSPSYDSLISSQCKAKCLSLYPWKLISNSNQNNNNLTFLLYRRQRSASSSNVRHHENAANRNRHTQQRVTFVENISINFKARSR